MIDSHTHLFLCERPEAEVVAAAREAGVGRMLNVGLGGDSNAEAIAGAERHEGVFAAVGPPPDRGRRASTRRRRRRSRGSPRTRRCGRSARPGSTTTATRRAPPTSAAPSRRRSRSPATSTCRSSSTPATPRASSEAIDEVFATLDARAPGHPVILHCFSAPQRAADAAERGWHCSFAGNVTYPKSEDLRAAAAQAARRAGPGRDRRALPDPAGDARASATSPPTSSPPPGSSPRRAASPTRSWSDGRGERAGRLRLVAAWSGSARTSSPTPTCSTRSSATPASRPRTSCWRSARGRGC